jgi:hypothetical protein
MYPLTCHMEVCTCECHRTNWSLCLETIVFKSPLIWANF